MIKANSSNIAENGKHLQGVNALYEEINSSAKDQDQSGDIKDQFSSIMDKIAARFSQNLGFDYTSLLATGAAQVMKRPEIQKESVQIDSKKQADVKVNNEDAEFRASNLTSSKEDSKKLVNKEQVVRKPEVLTSGSKDNNLKETSQIDRNVEANSDKSDVNIHKVLEQVNEKQTDNGNIQVTAKDISVKNEKLILKTESEENGSAQETFEHAEFSDTSEAKVVTAP